MTLSREAKAKLGEMLEKIKPQSSQKGRLRTLPDGITHKQSHEAQEIARHPEIVEEVKREAIARRD